MLDFINGVILNWGAYAGAAAAFVIAFDRLAKLTPTQTDDAIVAYAYKIFAILGVKVKDNPGDPASDGSVDPAAK